MTQPSFIVRAVSWQADRDTLHAIRRSVFIEEQQVPEELEWDEIDPHCLMSVRLGLLFPLPPEQR